MIEELIQQGSAGTGMSGGQVRSALTGALGLMHKHADRSKLEELYAGVPGTREMGAEGARSVGSGGGGLMGGLMKGMGGSGGKAMADALAMQGQLKRQGVSDEALKRLLPIAMNWVKEKTGRDLLREVAQTIPGVGGMLSGR